MLEYLRTTQISHAKFKSSEPSICKEQTTSFFCLLYNGYSIQNARLLGRSGYCFILFLIQTNVNSALLPLCSHKSVSFLSRFDNCHSSDRPSSFSVLFSWAKYCMYPISLSVPITFVLACQDQLLVNYTCKSAYFNFSEILSFSHLYATSDSPSVLLSCSLHFIPAFEI